MKRCLSLVGMLMLTIGLSMAASITATVVRYDAVELTGDGVERMTARYSQTNSIKSHLTRDVTATLVLENLPKGKVRRLVLSMKSNTKSGAGRMQLRVNGEEVWTIYNAPFADKSWHGAYSTEWVDVEKRIGYELAMGEVRMQIQSTENSLYFESLTIEYEPAIPEPYTVTFDTSMPDSVAAVREAEAGAGICLPTFKGYDEKGWHFIGWTERIIPQREEMPNYYRAGTMYFPDGDVTLHALYSTVAASHQIEQDTTYASGQYVIGLFNFEAFKTLATGCIVNHHLEPRGGVLQEIEDGRYALLADTVGEESRYQLTFFGDSVYLEHVETGQPIGYGMYSKGYQLDDVRTAWHWEKAKQHTLLISHDYLAEQNRLYFLGLDIPSSGDIEKATIKDISASRNVNHTYVALFPVDDVPTKPVRATYSSVPWHVGVENIVVEELDIEQPMEVYDSGGRLLMNGLLQEAELPAGIWILRQGENVKKIYR